ncbi:helix-turn-helix transcriptional regulator [Maricaulis sp.]|uniref:helix-turn-helix transcriptional regulator n=1 Tax=Maricaulis sp. TaxID=1486257 RepID=UPI003A92B681
MSPQYLGTSAAALRMGMSTSMMQRLRNEGIGPNFLRNGKRILYDIDDLDAWAQSRKRSAQLDRADTMLEPRRIVMAGDLPTLMALYQQRCEGLDFPDWRRAMAITGQSDTAIRHAAARLAATGILSLAPFRVPMADAGQPRRTGDAS